MNGIISTIATLINNARLRFHLMPHQLQQKIVLIVKVLIDGFFRHAQVLGNIIHRNTFNAILAKKYVGLLKYKSLGFHSKL